jgi:hypothetical protein
VGETQVYRRRTGRVTPRVGGKEWMMSDYHVYECDNCGSTDHYVWCDGRGGANPPSGWQRRGMDDWCGDCVSDADEEATEAEQAAAQTADHVLEAS